MIKKYWILISFFGNLSLVFGVGPTCRCPPRNVVLPDSQKGTIESQKAVCNETCTTTIISENISQVILFTFTHIPSSFMITIYDSGNPDPNRLLQNCKVDDGKQCYSSGNEVTFTFTSDWKEQTSTGTVELFILATDKSHAAALVKATTKVVKKWEIWIIVGGILLFLTIVGAISLLIIYFYRKKRAKEQIRTMQSCMIYASPTPVLQKYDVVW